MLYDNHALSIWSFDWVDSRAVELESRSRKVFQPEESES